MSSANIDPYPFLTGSRDLLALGLSRRDLRGGTFRQVFRGVAIRADVPDTIVVRARAALLLAPEGAIISHWTAAKLWGGWSPPDPWVHFSLMRDLQFRVDGIRHHRHRHRIETARRHGLLLTTPMQTFCQLARSASFLELVTLGDSLVRKNRFEPDDLVTYAGQWQGQCRREAVLAARLVRRGVDSAPETAVRLLMVLAGLPEPELDIHISHPDGTVRFRIELGFPRARLAIEYDGRWHDTPEQRAHDMARRAQLTEELGWAFEIITADDLCDHTEELLHRLRNALLAHGIPVPAILLDNWRRYFRCPTQAA